MGSDPEGGVVPLAVGRTAVDGDGVTLLGLDALSLIADPHAAAPSNAAPASKPITCFTGAKRERSREGYSRSGSTVQKQAGGW